MGYKVLSGWVLALLVGASSVLAGEPPKPAAKPDPAALRVEWHRTMAALLEARWAEKPDPARIRELRAKLDQLRLQAAPSAGVPVGLGPRAGLGWGAGMCWGAGPGRGMGWGRAAGPGAYCGLGAAWGPGFGRGAGWGAGAGWGRAFVDENQNGICDNYERLHAGQ